jgi:predicted nucleic acid-binding protein
LKTPGVIVDTSVWVEFLRSGKGKNSSIVEYLVKMSQAVTCGVVLAELLAGVRNLEDRRQLREALAGLDYLEMKVHTWRLAGELAADLRTKGRTVPMTDIIVAALSVEHGLSVLTADKHFLNVPGVHLYAV